MAILEPNHRIEAPSNQQGDREDEDFKPNPEEVSRILLSNLLSAVSEALEYFGHIESSQSEDAYDVLEDCYSTYVKHEESRLEI